MLLFAVYCSLFIGFMKDFSQLEKKLNFQFKNKDLLTEAFIHRSYINENPKVNLSHNERLEFLGDAVLELVVTEYLYNNYKNPEGELTSWRAALVNAQTLSQTAKDIGFNDYLLLSQGEAKDIGKARHYILANAFEAFIGAIYLDSGYEAAKDFIKSHLLKKLPEIIEKKLYHDPKSRFQEEAQERVRITPVYKVLKEWGPDHARHFIIGVYLGQELVAEGEGSSKQLAEEDAAAKALEIRGWTQS